MSNKKYNTQGKLLGITTVGERGQVVIPVEARKKMNLSKGDKLLVLSPKDGIITFIEIDKAKEFMGEIYKSLKNVLDKTE